MGAWIEIFSLFLLFLFYSGRPRMGAWIEILRRQKASSGLEVAPAWGRGLKWDISPVQEVFHMSPPHGGVD